MKASSSCTDMFPSATSCAWSASAHAECTTTQIESEAGSAAPVTLSTFKELLDRLRSQHANTEDLLPCSDLDVVRLNAAGLKQSLLPWPTRRLSDLHSILPTLAAGECALHNSVRACVCVCEWGRRVGISLGST